MADRRQLLRPLPYYGRAYLTTTRFLNGLQGAYAESPIRLSYSDDGGQTWSQPRGRSPGRIPAALPGDRSVGEMRRGSFSIPEVASDGTVFVHFVNDQNVAAWEATCSTARSWSSSSDGGVTSGPGRRCAAGGRGRGHAVLGDRAPDGLGPPDSVERDRKPHRRPDRPGPPRRRVRGPRYAEPERDRGCLDEAPAPPTYDPCNAGPGSDTNVYAVDPPTEEPPGPDAHPARRLTRPCLVSMGRPQARRRSCRRLRP